MAEACSPFVPLPDRLRMVLFSGAVTPVGDLSCTVHLRKRYAWAKPHALAKTNSVFLGICPDVGRWWATKLASSSTRNLEYFFLSLNPVRVKSETGARNAKTRNQRRQLRAFQSLLTTTCQRTSRTQPSARDRGRGCQPPSRRPTSSAARYPTTPRRSAGQGSAREHSADPG
jgi:hypothetical protein